MDIYVILTSETIVLAFKIYYSLTAVFEKYLIPLWPVREDLCNKYINI